MEYSKNLEPRTATWGAPFNHRAAGSLFSAKVALRRCLTETAYDSGDQLVRDDGSLFATYAGVHVGWVDATGKEIDIKLTRDEPSRA